MFDFSYWFGGEETSYEDGVYHEDSDEDHQDHQDAEESLQPLDPVFIEQVADLKRHCYDITVLQVRLDSEDAQRMDLLQDYIKMLFTIHMILQNASHDREELKSLPLSVQERLTRLLEWIRTFCETHRDPVDRIPFQSYLRTNIIENPYIQRKIME